VCPFCEHAVSEPSVALLAPKRVRRAPIPQPPRLIGGVPERTLLLVGTGVFASIAVIGIVLSALV
jgi:hypothetical protein